MANDSSLAGSPAQFAFDLETQKGVMSLLAAIRASELSPVEKNELRDLVLLYTNGGRDHSVRITIQQKVLTYGITPLVSTAPASEVKGFGSSRPAPSFSVSAPAQFVPVAAPGTAAPAAPTESTAQESVDVSTTVPAVESSPQLDAVVASAEPMPMTQPSPVAESAPVAASESVTPATSPASSAAPAAPAQSIAPAETAVPPVPVEAPVAGYSPDAALQRIREIKSLVNDKVGNPVNLVNIDNAVGREYMASLLDAMKKINSGSSAITAMQRLETAYQAVEKTIKERGTEPSTKPAEKTEVSAVTPEPAADPIPEPAVESTPIEAEGSPSSEEAPISAVVEEIHEATSEVEIAESPKAAARLEKVENSIPGYDLDVSAVSKVSATAKVEAPAGAPAPIPGKRSEEEIESAWGPATDTLKPPVNTALNKAQKAASLADAKDRLRSPDDLLSPADIASSSVSGDPLFTKEVDDGLQQLLSEWSLFKKSGLFGTGAKGREHPLFKKISTLQIPLLLAGRFEGATQEIKQSITDYMNGWRYEQGIIYEQGETFEHYLRRVIRHIIDLQKKKHQP